MWAWNYYTTLTLLIPGLLGDPHNQGGWFVAPSITSPFLMLLPWNVSQVWTKAWWTSWCKQSNDISSFSMTSFSPKVRIRNVQERIKKHITSQNTVNIKETDRDVITWLENLNRLNIPMDALYWSLLIPMDK